MQTQLRAHAPCVANRTRCIGVKHVPGRNSNVACVQHARRPILRHRSSLPFVPPRVIICASATTNPNSPLKVALDTSRQRLEEAQATLSQLEAQAQEIAQDAVEATRVRKEAEASLEAAMAEYEVLNKQQQDLELKATALRETMRGVLDTEKQAELEKATREAAESATRAQPLRLKVSGLVMAVKESKELEASAEARVATAMKLAEAAFEDVVQATVEVKETQAALTKTQTREIAAEPEGVAAAVISASATSNTVPNTAASSTTEFTEVEVLAAEKRAANKDWVKLGLVAALGAALAVFLTQTSAGASVVSYGQFLVDLATSKFGPIHLHGGEYAILETIYLLLFSVLCVPTVVRFIPGGSPVLGYLIGGFLVGPHALGLISSVETIKHIAEMGVVLMLFNIGLELSIDRLQSMAKYVFGLGSVQVIVSVLLTAAACMALAPINGSSAIILGGALTMSSTAVAVQVLDDRGEMGSRHGRATFSVLLFQDLAVVVLLMLIPLLAPSPDGSTAGMQQIAKALGVAAVKAVACIGVIIAGGRLMVQPLYRKISSFANPDLFLATTLLLCIGTSLMTQLCGLSLALGAFLAGLLISETEYALQVESDIASYKGLLMGLFFMSVGMEISLSLFASRAKEIIFGVLLLVLGKLAVVTAIGPLFGLPSVTSTRAGLLLAPGGEFAFVAFGEAVSRKVMTAGLASELYLVVALSMALIPYLAIAGAKLGDMLEKVDVQTMQPTEDSAHEMRDHVIILGFGRAGQVIAQVLSEQLIPFVALDVSPDAVAFGKKQDLPVYFGDAGSPAVLHLIGAEHAACAVVVLDTPGANYRAVWALAKHYPTVKTYVRARDVVHGLKLECAGATAVVPETLEPSLQLAAAVLNEMDFGKDKVADIVDDFRKNHIKELQVLSAIHGTSLGFGFSKSASALAAAAQDGDLGAEEFAHS